MSSDKQYVKGNYICRVIQDMSNDMICKVIQRTYFVINIMSGDNLNQVTLCVL